MLINPPSNPSTSHTPNEFIELKSLNSSAASTSESTASTESKKNCSKLLQIPKQDIKQRSQAEINATLNMMMPTMGLGLALQYLGQTSLHVLHVMAASVPKTEYIALSSSIAMMIGTVLLISSSAIALSPLFVTLYCACLTTVLTSFLMMQQKSHSEFIAELGQRRSPEAIRQFMPNRLYLKTD